MGSLKPWCWDCRFAYGYDPYRNVCCCPARLAKGFGRTDPLGVCEHHEYRRQRVQAVVEGEETP